MTRPDYLEGVDAVGVMQALDEFDPHIAGTLPIGVALPSSDIDILCHAPDLSAFASVVWTEFSAFENFALRQRTTGDRPVVASFRAKGWEFELFGSVLPVAKQAGWRHFVIEKRLLSLGGTELCSAILDCRRRGFKTEPAFAAVLGLPGNPYDSLLELETMTDEQLAEVLCRLQLAGRG